MLSDVQLTVQKSIMIVAGDDIGRVAERGNKAFDQ
jgi:hypothetical protein